MIWVLIVLESYFWQQVSGSSISKWILKLCWINTTWQILALIRLYFLRILLMFPRLLDTDQVTSCLLVLLTNFCSGKCIQVTNGHQCYSALSLKLETVLTYSALLNICLLCPRRKSRVVERGRTLYHPWDAKPCFLLTSPLKSKNNSQQTVKLTCYPLPKMIALT